MEAWTSLTVIDWEMAKRLAGNDLNLAKDMLSMLVNNLQTDLNLLNQLYQDKLYADLQFQIHKLHGALAYCGAVRLKGLVASIESNLKSKYYETLPELMQQLNHEAHQLMTAYPG